MNAPNEVTPPGEVTAAGEVATDSAPGPDASGAPSAGGLSQDQVKLALRRVKDPDLMRLVLQASVAALVNVQSVEAVGAEIKRRAVALN